MSGKTYRFGTCTVFLDPDAQRVTTQFPDGTQAVAVPNMDVESIARARGLGYLGDDESVVWAMTRNHDLMHTMLATAQGLPWSSVLWHVAHETSQPDPEHANVEERTVLMMQRLLAPDGGLAAILDEHLQRDETYDKMLS